MKKLRFLPIIALLFMTLISCEKDQFEPVTSLDGQEEMVTTRANATVPFKAKFDNTINSDSTYIDEDGNLHEYITGIGKATHAGKSTIAGPTTVYGVFVVPLSDPPIFNPPPSEDGYFQDGYFTFVAADGSAFIIDYSGTTSPAPPDFFAGQGTYDIRDESGTGRFVGTTGTGDYSYVATQDPVTFQVTSKLEFTGTLTNP